MRRLAHPYASVLLRVSLTCLLKIDEVFQKQAGMAAAGPRPACPDAKRHPPMHTQQQA